jgi:phage/plasmid-associated DNA primase
MLNEIKNRNAGNVGELGEVIGVQIYINKQKNDVTPLDVVEFGKLIERYTTGLLPISHAALQNVSYGFRLIVGRMVDEMRRHPEKMRKDAEFEPLRRIKMQYLTLWRINMGLENVKRTMTLTFDDADTYFPGPIHIADALLNKGCYKTRTSMDAKSQELYVFDQIYKRGESQAMADAAAEFMRQWKGMLARSENEKNTALTERLRNALHRGPSVNEIKECIETIKRITFTDEPMNPDTHIPFKNKGLFNLKTKKYEPFDPGFFYTYAINASPVDTYVTLNDVPLFRGLLDTAYFEPDIPMVLSYMAYTLYPSFPVEKVLNIFGVPRVGKGSTARICEYLNPDGSTSFSLKALITQDRFQYSGFEGKNLLIDYEAGRSIKRGQPLNFGTFTSLFGNDRLPYEKKGKEKIDMISKAKGIVLSNLPSLKTLDPAFLSRILPVETRNEKPKVRISDLPRKIVTKEGDKIAKLLIQILLRLIQRNFVFPGEMTEDAVFQLMEHLSNPVEYFISEVIEDDEYGKVSETDLLIAFSNFCAENGITEISKNLFTRTFAKKFERKKQGTRENRQNFYIGCRLLRNENDDEKKVGHQVGRAETRNLRVSGERYRRVHLLSLYSDMRLEGGSCKRYTEQKLDTTISAPGNREIRDFQSNKPVSNFFRDENQEPLSNNTKSPETTVKYGISDDPLLNDPTTETNHSYLMKKNILDTVEKILSENKNAKIGTDEILNNWTNGVDKPSFKELEEKILPTMAASGLLSLHNGVIQLTDKPLVDTPLPTPAVDPSTLTHLLIIQDIPEFAWTDGDWKLRKNDDAYVPSELAKTLINRGWATEIPKPGDQESITDSTVSNPKKDNTQEEPKNLNPTTTEPITKEQGDKAVQVLHERRIHLNGADTGVSVYGDKYNIAVPVNFYRQNSEKVDQIMGELGFSKGNTGQLHNVFFDRSLKGGEAQ